MEAACFSQTLVQPTRLHGAVNQVAIIWTLLIYRADNSVAKIMESYNSEQYYPIYFLFKHIL
jgi:hypothetical protein